MAERAIMMGWSLIKKSLLALLAVFAAMQCFRPEKNAGVGGTAQGDLFSRYGAPPEVRKVVENACYDCHSNRTRYPWYAEIQPGGWLLAQHVRDGKRRLNFSEFGQLPPQRAIRQLEACVDEIEEGEMPLKSYTWVHRDARLSPAQIAAVVTWIEKTMEGVEGAELATQALQDENARLSLD